jgi:hypothetical protein
MKLGFEILSVVWLVGGLVSFINDDMNKAIFSLIFCIINILWIINLNIKKLKKDV